MIIGLSSNIYRWFYKQFYLGQPLYRQIDRQIFQNHILSIDALDTIVFIIFYVFSGSMF
jgi:hypothetical protein